MAAICIGIGPVALADSASEIIALSKRVSDLYEAKKYAEAVPFAEREVKLSEALSGKNKPETATSLNNLANLYRAMGDYAKAEPLFQRVLAIREKALGQQHPSTVASLNNLGLLYQASGEYGKSEALLQRVLAIREKALGLEHADVASSLNNLAVLYQTIGNYRKAEEFLTRALAQREKTLGLDHPDTATSCNNLASLYQATGDYGKAEPLYQQALGILEKSSNLQPLLIAHVLNNLADLYRAMGDYSKAEPLFQRTLAIREKTLGPDHLETVTSLNNLGTLYWEIGDYAKAETAFLKTLFAREKLLGPQHPDTAVSVNNLAMTYNAMGNPAKAEPFYKRALEINEKAVGAQHPHTMISVNNLASFYQARGDYAKAESLFQRALTVREKALGPEHPDTAASLNNIGMLYHAMRRFPEAEPLMRRALAIFEKSLGREHPATATLLSNLCRLNLDLGRSEDALGLARRADKAENSILGNILSFTSEQERLTFQKSNDPFTLSATLGDPLEIAEVVLRNKGVVLDSLQEDRLIEEASADAAHREVIDQIREAKRRLTHVMMEVPKDVSVEALKRRETEREIRAREVERLEASLGRKFAGLGRARRALTVSVKEVQAALFSDRVLVEFLRYRHFLGKDEWEARYGAVVIAAAGDPRWVPLGSAIEIEKGALIYGKSANGTRDQTALRIALRNVYDQVWGPVEKALPTGAKEVIISPDGDLSFISFATLLTLDERFLAEKYSIRYAASGRDLLRDTKAADSKVMALFGDPAFGEETEASVRKSSAIQTTGYVRSSELRDFNRISLAPLPGTAIECTALKVQPKGSGISTRIFLGKGATEEQLRHVESPRILHLATHGFFLPESIGPHSGKGQGGEMGPDNIGSQPIGKQVWLTNPMHRSGLALSGAQHTLDTWAKGVVPPSENDGIVTAEEVGGLKLQGTWLVTLSACDTGIGEARAGEGVMGLRRGFIQAGAQNLLMTLWAISDETTVEIMKDFYGRALKTGNAPQALSDTQREWLVKIREEKGLAAAVKLAGPFIMSSQGKQ